MNSLLLNSTSTVATVLWSNQTFILDPIDVTTKQMTYSEKAPELNTGEPFASYIINKVASLGRSFFDIIRRVDTCFSQIISFPPGASAFDWSNLDPTRGLRKLEEHIQAGAERLGENINAGMERLSEHVEGAVSNVGKVITGEHKINPDTVSDFFHKANIDVEEVVHKAGRDIEQEWKQPGVGGLRWILEQHLAGLKNVAKLVTGEHKINPSTFDEVVQKAGGDIKDEWDRTPSEIKVTLIVAAAAAAGWGAAYLIAQGTVLSLGVAGTNGVVIEVLTYSTASGLQVAPIVSGGVLSGAAWAKFYDEMNKDPSSKEFELRKPTIDYSLDPVAKEKAEQALNQQNQDPSDIEISFEESARLPGQSASPSLSLKIFSDLSIKPDVPGESNWIGSDNPIRLVMPNIPMGKDSRERWVIRDMSERLMRAMSTNWDDGIIKGKRSVPLSAARAMTVFSLIHDFIRIPVETRKAVNEFLRGAIVAKYGSCDHPVISSPTHDSNLDCALHKRDAQMKEAGEFLDSIRKELSNRNSEFEKRWKEAEEQNPERFKDIVERVSFLLPTP